MTININSPPKSRRPDVSPIARQHITKKQKGGKMLTVCKIFTFSAAHFLPNHKGQCKELHGHNYKLEIEIQGAILKDGMIMDFAVLKDMVNTLIISKLDHKCLNDIFDNPTAEEMVRWIENQLEIHLSFQNLRMTRIRLWETDTCYAEWRASL